MKQPKVLVKGTLYAVIKISSTMYAAVLASDFTKVQRSGSKELVSLWAEENDL